MCKLLVITGVVLATFSARAEEFCAMRVIVKSSFGMPVSVPVELLSPEGKPLDIVTTDKAGVAEFCDFGLGPHSVVVARGKCGQTTISNVNLTYGSTQTLRVILNFCVSNDRTIFGCLAYFRIMDEDRRPLPGVLASGGTVQVRSDNFGRMQIHQDSGVRSTIHFVLRGFELLELPLYCQHPSELQRELILKRLPN